MAKPYTGISEPAGALHCSPCFWDCMEQALGRLRFSLHPEYDGPELNVPLGVSCDFAESQHSQATPTLCSALEDLPDVGAAELHMNSRHQHQHSHLCADGSGGGKVSKVSDLSGIPSWEDD